MESLRFSLECNFSNQERVKWKITLEVISCWKLIFIANVVDRLCSVLRHIWACHNSHMHVESSTLGMHCIVFIRICFTELYLSRASNGLQWASVLHKKQCLLDPRQSLLCYVLCQIFGLEREMLSKHRDGMLGFAQNAHNWLSALDEGNRWIHVCVFSSWL